MWSKQITRESATDVTSKLHDTTTQLSTSRHITKQPENKKQYGGKITKQSHRFSTLWHFCMLNGGPKDPASIFLISRRPGWCHVHWHHHHPAGSPASETCPDRLCCPLRAALSSHHRNQCGNLWVTRTSFDRRAHKFVIKAHQLRFFTMQWHKLTIIYWQGFDWAADCYQILLFY